MDWGSFLSIFVPPFSSLSLWSFGHAIFHSSFQHSRLPVKIIFVLWKPKKRSKRNRNKSNRSLSFSFISPLKFPTRHFFSLSLFGLLHRPILLRIQRPRPNPIPIPKEQNLLAGPLGADAGLDPLARPGGPVHGAQEAPGTVLGVGAVVLAHDLLDGLGGLVGVVEGDGGDVVVEHVGLDDAVEERAADEAHLAVDGGGGAADEVPFFGVVVGEGGVGVLEVGDGDCQRVSGFFLLFLSFLFISSFSY